MCPPAIQNELLLISEASAPVQKVNITLQEQQKPKTPPKATSDTTSWTKEQVKEWMVKKDLKEIADKCVFFIFYTPVKTNGGN